MSKYNTGKVYKIKPIINNDDTDIYIGSTIKKLNSRFNNHKGAYKAYQEGKTKNKLSVFKLFDKYGVNGCEIILIESYNCETKEELLNYEKQHIKNNNCVNQLSPITTEEELKEYNKEYKKEYRETHKEELKKANKEYRETHKEELSKSKCNYYYLNYDKIEAKRKEVNRINNIKRDYIMSKWSEEDKENFLKESLLMGDYKYWKNQFLLYEKELMGLSYEVK